MKSGISILLMHLYFLVATGMASDDILLICNHNVIAEPRADTSEQIIDSLIQVIRINEKVIIVKFGSDAITAIKTQQGIVVIDAGISIGLTAKYRKIVESEFGSTNFTCLINTHGHHDHTRGNNIFTGAKIISHENAIKEIESQWQNPEKVAMKLAGIVDEYTQQLKECDRESADWYSIFINKCKYEYCYADASHFVPVRLPDTSFSDSLILDKGDVTFEMIHFGESHSASDILIWVPEMKLLFTGDLFFQYGRPSFNADNNNRAKWLTAIKWIEDRFEQIDVIITGHGQLLSVDDLASFNRIVHGRIKSGSK